VNSIGANPHFSQGLYKGDFPWLGPQGSGRGFARIITDIDLWRSVKIRVRFWKQSEQSQNTAQARRSQSAAAIH